MQNILKNILIGCFFLATLPIKAQTDQQAMVKVSGEVTKPLSLTETDLQKFPQTTVTRKDKDGKDHVYNGVLLATILEKAGVTLGKDLKGKNLTKYVLLGARDGYHVIFALAELEKDFTDRLIILADTIDGKPLTEADGPFRVIVQDEKKPARCIRQVSSIVVVLPAN